MDGALVEFDLALRNRIVVSVFFGPLTKRYKIQDTGRISRLPIVGNMDAAQLGRITVGLVPQKEQVLLSPGKKSRVTALFSLFFLPGDIKDLILESLIKVASLRKKC